MTAKIKLNAASGGGSISINAPSSSGSDTDFLDTSGNLAVSGTTTCTGNLKAGTITDTSGNNSSTTAEIAQGRVKAWINFDMNAGSITDSFNVAGINDDGTGLFTVTYSSAFSNTNYCILSGQASKITDDSDNRFISRVLDRATTNMQVEHNFIENGNSNRYDSRFMYFAILA